ncbi:hypothetical protein ACEWY4_020011 [Coilia grayii]|uniref:non-specific serine/threonine protein kinase n=1 Tax=Coilia grayii TaxID=363190 RepID=A0ABD1JBE5_9TELE
MAHHDTRTLAEGFFGKVYKEKYKDQWAAMKRVPVSMISREQLERECRVYHNARHPNIVKLLGEPWLRDLKWNIPLEFITGEELETTIFCSQKSKIKLTPAVRATIISGMCAGLCHLHSNNIVHQDIKPDNIMVEHETNRAVIIDLGLAKFFRNGLTSAANLGNEAYSAPEILVQQGVRDTRSDVWAMGKVIAELCARVRLPTLAVTPTKIQETLAAHPYSVAVSKMVDPNPNRRVNMALALVYIREAEEKVRQEEKAREPKLASPDPKAGVGRAGGDNTTGLHQRGGLQAPPQAERSPSPARSRFQPAAPQMKEEVKPGNVTRFGGEAGGLHQRGGVLAPPQAEVHRSPSPARPSRFQPAAPQMNEEIKPGNVTRFGGGTAGLHQRTGLQAPPQEERSPSPARSRFQPAAPHVKQEDKAVVNREAGNGLTRFGGKPAAAGLQPRAQQQTPFPRAVLENKVSPITELQHKPHDEIKTLVPAKNLPTEGAITHLLQQMTPFPCPLPTTGKILHSRYEYDGSRGGVFEVKEVETVNGKITKFEGFKTNIE